MSLKPPHDSGQSEAIASAMVTAASVAVGVALLAAAVTAVLGL